MSLSDTSIRNPVFAWMMMAFLIIFGALCFQRLGISQMPDVDFPQVTISVTLEGASPEIIESDVIDPIEDEIMSVEGIREVTASARQGHASISIEFDLSKDIDVAVQEIQTKIAQAGNKLPREIDPPIVSKQNSDDNPFMWVAVSGHAPLQDIVLYAKDHLKPKFQTIPGVGELTMGGFLERNMRIWLKLEELESRDMAVEDVVAALQREHVEVPAGRIESGTREMNARSIGEATSVEEFRKIVVAYRNGAPVLLGQIAVVEDGLEDRRRIARSLGVPAIGMGVKKQFGANSVEIARAVRAKVAEIQKDLPPGINVEVNSDMTVFVEEAIHEIQFNLVLSVILTSIACWIFLGSWSSTINILFAIPTSIVGAFIVIYFLGFTLNTFTLLALSLAIGIVVDDAIMVLENIVRHGEKGKNRVRAASDGAREITLAALAATLSIIAIFLPIAFMRGIIGKFLYQFGVTLSVAVALSLLEALTLTPMRCSQMLRVRTGETRGFQGMLDRFFKRLARGYRGVLAPCLRWSWAVLLLSVLVFGGSLWLIARVPQEMVPKQDQSMLFARIATAAGSTADYTDSRLRACEAILEEHRLKGTVNRYFAVVGGFMGGEVDSGIVFLTLRPPEKRAVNPATGRPWTQHEFQDHLRARFNAIPGLKYASVSDLSMRGLTARGANYHMQFSISGSDWTRLGELSEELVRRMRESGYVADAVSEYQVGMPELKILPDRDRAADLGVSARSIGDTVNAMIGGIRVGKFNEGGHRYDVRIRLVSDQRSRPEDVTRLMVRNRDGQLVRLSEVVQVFEQATVQSITRRNRQRAITVSANVAPGKSQKDANDAFYAVASEILPEGYGIEPTGSSALFKDTGSDFLLAIGLGVIIAYMILASQFNSFVHPTLVLLAMPFSLTGAVLAMMATGVTLNMYSMIGVVLLMGIVKKNSILLVEFTNQVRERLGGADPAGVAWLGAKGVFSRVPQVQAEHRRRREILRRRVGRSLLRACPIRLRPILMTSVSTIAAAGPPAFALGPGAETTKAMAVVVIGGVAVSTLLTLVVVPCAYFLVPGRVRGEREWEHEMAAAPETPAPSRASELQAEPGSSPLSPGRSATAPVESSD